MIILSQQIQSVLMVYGEQNSAAKNTKVTKTKPDTGRDQVILSSSVKEFGQILQSVIAMPDVRPEKVQELSKQIDAGTYHVDSREIADKMIGRGIVDKLI